MESLKAKCDESDSTENHTENPKSRPKISQKIWSLWGPVEQPEGEAEYSGKEWGED